MNWALNIAENGWVPDPLIKSGIRRLLRHRIHSIDSIADGGNSVIEQMSNAPIAVDTDTANEQHYELPPRFFELVLGRHLKYSGCTWLPGVSTLDEAEAAALEQTCRRARIRDGMSVLELGCGWGSLTLWMAERYPRSHVTAVSNSAPQGNFIRERARERGLDNVDVLTADMNEFHPGRRFDRVVSVEMFEHMRNYQTLLDRVASWLEDEGKLFVHIFCHRQYPYFFEDRGAGDWMARHFFTGGLMPSERLMETFSGPLGLDERWRVNGKNYEKTALAWLANLDAHEAEVSDLFAATYGPTVARKWFHRWRMFFLACAELFAYNNGEEWFVSHSLWSSTQTPVN